MRDSDVGHAAREVVVCLRNCFAGGGRPDKVALLCLTLSEEGAHVSNGGPKVPAKIGVVEERLHDRLEQ